MTTSLYAVEPQCYQTGASRRCDVAIDVAENGKEKIVAMQKETQHCNCYFDPKHEIHRMPAWSGRALIYGYSDPYVILA